MNKSHNGVSRFFHEEGHAEFYMLQDLDGFKRKWDKGAGVPYLRNRKKKLLVSYDDEQSIAKKAYYILDNNAGGVIIWTIAGDYMENGDTPLLEVLHQKLGD